MPIYINDAGAWKNIRSLSFHESGSWKDIRQAYVRVSGEYKPLLGWDVGSASYNGVSINASQVGLPGSPSFNDTGTKMFILDRNSDRIQQYSLTAPWDLSSFSYDNISLDVSIQSPSVHNSTFSSDGLHLYTVGSSGFTFRVFQYDMTTPWNMNTATYAGQVHVSDDGTRDVEFSPDGNRMFVSALSGSDYQVISFELSTPWEVSTASLIASKTIPGATGLVLKPDGRRMFVINGATSGVDQYHMSNAWDLTTAVLQDSYDARTASGASQAFGLGMSVNGDRMYTTDWSSLTNNVFQFTL